MNRFFLYGKTKWFLFKEDLFHAFHNYKNFRYASSDLLLKTLYLLKNPYTLSREFFEKKSLIYQPYGETPIRAYREMAKRCKLQKEEYILELGAGRGRGAFFLSDLTGSNIEAVEWIESFMKKANFIKKLFGWKRVKFTKNDFLHMAIDEKITFIYLYGTCLEGAEIEKLHKKFSSLRKGTKLLTISYAFSDLFPGAYHLIEKFSIRFPWGKTFAYYQTIQ